MDTRRGTVIMRTFQISLLVGSIAAAIVVSRAEDWQPVELLLLLATLTLLSGAFPLKVKKVSASGSFLGIVLTMGLLGPAPAVALALLAQLPLSIATRAKFGAVVCNLSGYATFALLGGLAMRPVPAEEEFAVAGALFLVFLATNFLNFLAVAVDIRVTEGGSVARSVREVFAPVLPVQIASALLTASIAYGYVRYGIEVIVFLAAAGLVFQYLLHLVLESMNRGEQLEKRTHELASLQVGLLTTVLNTLSLRDKMTARHSAAVARYSRAIARELGLDEQKQDVIHTAALLHDIGKFVFPDDILLADTRLTDEQYELVKTHPARGAELVEKIEGYGPVAEIVRSHHERIDGRGYPDGLIADAIPLGSRIIAVCDTYDVMTARDSYRKPVAREEAVAELRRVAGAQLDAHIVDVFIRLLREQDIAFRHSDDADFVAELNFDVKVRDYAAPRRAAVRV